MRLIDSVDRTARATTDPVARPVQHTAPAIIPAVKRRGVMRLLGAGGIAFIATVAGMAEDAKPAAAATVTPSYCNAEYCCDLRYVCDNVCWGGCNFTCPSGYYRHTWYCQYANRIIGCGECTGNSGLTCWNGPWYCSVSFDDGAC